MEALRKHIGMDLIGGAHDLDRFDSIKDTKPFLPVVQGPDNKLICAFINTATDEILKVYPEHLGFFLEKIGTEPELRKMVGVARGVIAQVQEQKLFVADDKVEIFDGTTEELLVAARGVLDELVTCIEQKRVQVAAGANQSENSYPMLLLQLELRGAWAPHTAFLELAQMYTTIYQKHYGLGDFLTMVASMLHLDDVWPLATTKRILTPLFVDDLIQEDVEMMVNGAMRTLTERFIIFKPFKGFILETSSKGDLSESEALDNPELAKTISLKLDRAQMTKVGDRDAALRAAILSINASTPAIRALKQELKTNEDFFMAIDRMAQPQFVKLAKKILSTTHMVAVLQSTLRSCIVPWGINDVSGTTTSMADTELLTKLRRQVYARMFADFVLLRSAKVPMGALGIRDIGIKMEDKYWAPRKDTLGEQEKILQLYHTQGMTLGVEWMNKIGLEPVEIRPQREPGRVFPVTCLWSVYNGTEFTEFGTLTAGAGGKGTATGGAKYGTVDMNDHSKFKYVFKGTPAAPPASIIGLVHMGRMALMGVVGVSIYMAGEFSGDENLNLDLISSNRATTSIMRKMGERFFTGYFFNIKADDQLVKSSFSTTFGVFGSKGRAFLNKRSPNESGPLSRSAHFNNKLEWLRRKVIANPALVKQMSRNINALIERYDTRAMVLDQVETKSLFYLRPILMTPYRTEIPMTTILSKRGDFSNSPVLLHTNMLVASISATSLYFTLPQAPVFNKWDQHQVYGVIIEHNRGVYSEATRASWSTMGGAQSLGTDTGVDSLMCSLLAQVCDDEPVTSEMINMFSLDRARYTAVVERLAATGRFQETEPRVYGDDLTMDDTSSGPSTTPEDAATTLVFQPFEKDGGTKRAAETIRDLWGGPPTKMSRIDGDDD
ncbi:ORF43 [Silurid herpesvirus 1]|nr:ORF43 [Silurid herpesvirus 1]